MTDRLELIVGRPRSDMPAGRHLMSSDLNTRAPIDMKPIPLHISISSTHTLISHMANTDYTHDVQEFRLADFTPQIIENDNHVFIYIS